MKRYQWLLFDADGTLFDYDSAEKTALTQALHSIGVPTSPGHLTAYQGINQALWLALEKGEVTPERLKVRRFELLFESIGVDHAPDAFSAQYLECLADCSALIEGAFEAVQALQKNYRLAILTNGLKAVQRRRLARSALQPHIAELIISEEIGFSKPAKGFFEAAFARLGNPLPQETLMIGDNWSADILGAIGYGMDACWFNPARKSRPDIGQATKEISSLGELVDWLA